MTENLAQHTTFRVGGPARRLVTARTETQLAETVRDCDRRGEPVLILGDGSNTLVGDAGFDGTAVLVRTDGVRQSQPTSARVEWTIAAGESWDGVVARAVEAGLAGVEALSGIPGRAGATPVQNVGAYGQEVASAIGRVRVWDRRENSEVRLAAAECGFGYRTSRFKREPGRYLVLDVTLLLEPSVRSSARYPELAARLGLAADEPATLARIRAAVLELRRSKGMVLDDADHDTWSAGSFFTNPVVPPRAADRLPQDVPRYPAPDGQVKTSAAWLIEHAGFARGHGGPQAALSGKHVLALTNRGQATAADILALAREVRDGVRARFGVELVPEPVFVGCSLDG